MAEQGDPKAPVGAQGTLAAWRPPGGGVPAASMLRPIEDIASAKTALPSQDGGQALQYEDVAAPLSVGAVVGQRYVIEKHISSGGFGAVYLASDREIRHHHVALKLLHRASASEQEREAALRELMLIATVSHPCVVQFKDYGWHEGRLWFAMPWYRGKTLDRVLGQEAGGIAMSRKEARPIFEFIAQGLAAMHAASVHHHDIKPENIFLAEIDGFPGGLPVLLDLGIATQRGENPKGLTVEYASPETAAAMLGMVDKPVGAAADVFSLALVLRNALDPSVASPVQTDNVLPILHQRATELAELPKGRDLLYLQPYFRRWLSLDPEERPSAAEFAEQLAILTAPEERREARMRVLRRVVPIVVIAGLLIAGLVFQVKKQGTQISAQEKELAEQEQLQAELRQRSETQLKELESRSSELGTERQRLEQAIVIARQLNAQLAGAAKQNDQLSRRVAKVTSERDAVSQERDSVTVERNQLRDANTRVRDERDSVARERDRIATERAQAIARRDELEQRIKELNKEAARLEAEHTSKYEKAARDRDEAVARQGELQSRVDDLKSDKQRLQDRLAGLEAKLSKLESSTETGDASSTKKPARKKKPKTQ